MRVVLREYPDVAIAHPGYSSGEEARMKMSDLKQMVHYIWAWSKVTIAAE